jgi:hypothetical protein
MIIGVPCARTANESRVGLTPSAAGALVREGRLITRDTVITLASEWGIAPVTRVDGRAVGTGEPVYGSAGVPCSAA